MSINAATTSSTQVSSSSATSQASTQVNTDNAKKSSSESSFKDEMNKVSTKEQASSEKNISETSEKKESVKSNNDKSQNEQGSETDLVLEGSADYSKFASMAVLDANSMLTNDIRQVMGLGTAAVEETDNFFNTKGFMTLDFTKSLFLSESDANFFLKLTKNNDVSVANITTQAQTMLNNGAEFAEVKQNVQISQTLLDAISKARENNQPLRIDFDQNISVILRINKEGVVSANFIPGDKAVEQYLRNNISNLKATFDEQDLPYSDLSYSNRGSKQQKERRNNNNK